MRNKKLHKSITATHTKHCAWKHAPIHAPQRAHPTRPDKKFQTRNTRWKHKSYIQERDGKRASRIPIQTPEHTPHLSTRTSFDCQVFSSFQAPGRIPSSRHPDTVLVWGRSSSGQPSTFLIKAPQSRPSSGHPNTSLMWKPEHVPHLGTQTRPSSEHPNTFHIWAPEHLPHLGARTPSTSGRQNTFHIWAPEHLPHLGTGTLPSSGHRNTSLISAPEHLPHLGTPQQ